MKKLTNKMFVEWRTGLHAAHPSEAQALVAEIDALKNKVLELEKENQEQKALLEQARLNTVMP